jgi:hypothetical protein
LTSKKVLTVPGRFLVRTLEVISSAAVHPKEIVC